MSSTWLSFHQNCWEALFLGRLRADKLSASLLHITKQLLQNLNGPPRGDPSEDSTRTGPAVGHRALTSGAPTTFDSVDTDKCKLD